MIVATAGHIDHGKTTLVKALTGIDTDHLPEEKRRGLTIDLGFAYENLTDGSRISFVDVPGHERFVKTMIAGATGIDFALLVIAADDGPMPQTTEHLAILDLLGVQRGLVALTKCDRVDLARRQEVTAEIQALLRETALSEIEIVPCSALTGTGIDALKSYLQIAATATPPHPTDGNFRLAVDRAFTIAGAGLVVTGAAHAGTVHTEDNLILSPQGVPVRVRGLHALNEKSGDGTAGQRIALNITAPRLGINDISRGSWIVATPAHAPTDRLDVRLHLLKSESRPLRHWTPVHLHLGTAELTGRVAVLDGQIIAPGDKALAQIVLDAPIGALAGDRLILRDQSARRTIAGGQVIDPFPPRRGRARPQRLLELAAFENETAQAALNGLLAIAPNGIALAPFACARNLTPSETELLLGTVPMVAAGHPDELIAFEPTTFDAIAGDIEKTLVAAHAANPQSPGPTPEPLRRALSRRLPADRFNAVLATLVGNGRLTLVGGSIRLPNHETAMAPADKALWKRIEPLLAEGHMRPPLIREIATAVNHRPQDVERFLLRARRLGLVVRVTSTRFFLKAALRDLTQHAEELSTASPDGFDVAAFRDTTGIGRNLAVEVLEFFDAKGFTKRTENRRTLAKAAMTIFS